VRRVWVLFFSLNRLLTLILPSRQVRASAFAFCFPGRYVITKKKSVNISAYRIYREFRIFEFIKYFKERWSVKILIIVKIPDSSARHCPKARIKVSIFFIIDRVIQLCRAYGFRKVIHRISFVIRVKLRENRSDYFV
jgi:hypothetical protein